MTTIKGGADLYFSARPFCRRAPSELLPVASDPGPCAPKAALLGFRAKMLLDRIRPFRHVDEDVRFLFQLFTADLVDVVELK